MLGSVAPKARRAVREPSLVLPYVADRLTRTRLAEDETLYRAALRLKGCDGTVRPPSIGTPPRSAVLQSETESRDAVRTLNSLGLHTHPDDPKNWDALLALRSILKVTESDAAVLDAGGATYSPLLEWLYLYGYRDLYAYNIDFDRDFSRGPIRYVRADFTETAFDADRFDALTMLSVIEHGVDPNAAFAEFHRLLKPGGRLLLSTDYWPTGRTTDGTTTEYGDTAQNWHLFDDESIVDLIAAAEEAGFDTPIPPNGPSVDPVVDWQGHEFTYVYLQFDA